MAPQPSDEDLFAAYVAGDRDAFRQLFDRYSGPLTRLMRQQIRNPQDAGELVQQTFLQLHRARRDFRQGARLKPWLYTIALNLRRGWFRTRGRRPETPLDPARHPLPTVDPVDLTRGEDAQRVRTALEGLTATQREVIELHWFEELSFPEVAQVLGANVNTVKVRAHRGYKVLRAALADDDGQISGRTAEGSWT